MSNVIALPSASKRKVRQPDDAASRKALVSYRDANPWPGEFVWPKMRAMQKQWADDDDALSALAASGQGAVIGAAIYAVLDEGQKTRVRQMLARRSARGCTVFKVALDTLKWSEGALEREVASFARDINMEASNSPFGGDAA